MSCSAASCLLLVAEGPALRRQLVGGCRVASPPAFADLLRQLVDARPHGVSLGGDLAQPGVELGGGGGLLEQLGPVPAAEGAEHAVEVGAQQADVDHRAATLPGSWSRRSVCEVALTSR